MDRGNHMSTILVTGANRGVGLELCRQFSGRGEAVIGVCRTASEPLIQLLGVEVVADIDVTQPSQVTSLVERLGDRTLDVLVNNAGILDRGTLGEIEYDNVIRQFEVNAIGPLRITEALLPLLSRGAKVAIVTSRMGSISDNDSGGTYGYRMSKAAVNAAGKSLAIDLSRREIAVTLLHPGWVRTDMTGHKGLVDVDEAAAGLIARIDALTLADTGSFWHANGERLPW
jgi:NAD(P)-dependent dehydrogenase (short-subunit alcohol dehydrogenase family)